MQQRFLDEFSKLHELSPREIDIFALLTERVIAFREIAQRLTLSPSTVNNHFKSIFQKTGTSSKSELLALFLSFVMTKFSEKPVLQQVPRVLVIDDEIELCEIIVEYLKGKGIKAYGLTDPTKAMDWIASTKLDAVICDVKMPKLTGTELLVLIRNLYRCSPPVVLMTGLSTDAKEKYLDQGAAAVLEKPIDLSTLAATITDIVLGHSSERASLLGIDRGSALELDRVFDLHSWQLGSGGVFLPLTADEVSQIGRSLIPEQLIRFRFTLEDRPQQFLALGRIVWRRLQTKDDQTPGMGIRFVELSESDFESVLAVVREKRIMSYIPMGPGVKVDIKAFN